MYAVKGNSFRAIDDVSQLQDGEVASSIPPDDAVKWDAVKETKQLMSRWLDEVVQGKGYDDIVSCASYANSTVEKFRLEALAAIAWRDALYARGYEILADVPDGVTTPVQVMELLPKPEQFGWVAE